MVMPPPEPHGLMCHYFHDDPLLPRGHGFPKAQGSLSVDDFNRLLDAYGNRLVPAKSWLMMAMLNGLGDAVAITFDDGLYEAYVLALPVLEERGLTAFWNIYTGPYVGVPNNMELYRWVRNHGFGGVGGFYALLRPELMRHGLKGDALWDDAVLKLPYLSAEDRAFRRWRDAVSHQEYEERMDWLVTKAGMDNVDRQWWMTPTQLRDLHRSGHVIGTHTHSHPYDMTKLSCEQTALEHATAKAVLAGVLECSPSAITTMSHPRGIWDPGSAGYLKGLGYVLAWASSMKGEAPWMTPRWSTGNWTAA